MTKPSPTDPRSPTNTGSKSCPLCYGTGLKPLTDMHLGHNTWVTSYGREPCSWCQGTGVLALDCEGAR